MSSHDVQQLHSVVPGEPPVDRERCRRYAPIEHQSAQDATAQSDFTPRFAAARERAIPDLAQGDPMTTSAQQSVLSEEEIRCLLAIANGDFHFSDQPTLEILAAKGMIDGVQPTAVLTPAGQHAIHVSEPGRVPGIDT